MKLTDNFDDIVISHSKKMIKTMLDNGGGKHPDTYMFNVVYATCFAMLNEYHNTLARELNKQGLNIGQLE